MSKHEELIVEAKQKFPDADNITSALGKLSIVIFEELTSCQDLRSKQYSVLREKYFRVRAAYNHEYYKMTADSNFIKMDVESGNKIF
jgi:hypothetical protein